MFFNKKNHLATGREGEKLAEKYLKKAGYKILNKNWFNKKGKRIGEIDIIAQNKNNEIIFVEVKTRKIDEEKEDAKEVNPEEQITSYKMSKLQRIAEKYIDQNDLWENDWRFDAISVIFYVDNQKPKIEHFKNIFF